MPLPLSIFTLVLDGIAFLPAQLATFNRLKDIDWTWSIVEGVAAPVNDTKWCKEIPPRLSKDGTTEFLNSLRGHPHVRVYQKQLWEGKTAMCNAALADIKRPCVLLQVDMDEFWQDWQLESIARTVTGRAYFYARYFVGPNIVTSTENAYGNNPGEFLRAWQFMPGMKFATHEPPVLIHNGGPIINRDTTRRWGLVFDHLAYVLEPQVRFKETYYGYKGAMEGWLRLQRNTVWPTKLKPFFHWADDGATADLLWKQSENIF